MSRPKILVFASGTKTGGGSGFRRLVEESTKLGGNLAADIIGVVSNHLNGGVKRIADEVGVPFYFFDNARNATGRQYQYFVSTLGAEWVALSGWLKLVKGLNPATTFNIHPGPLPKFGGPGMYGHHVHEAVMAAFGRGELTHSAVSMHFVDQEYDHGNLFFKLPVEIEPDDTPDSLGARVNKQEHVWQSFITDLVVHRHIRLTRAGNLIVPAWYRQMPFCPLTAIK